LLRSLPARRHIRAKDSTGVSRDSGQQDGFELPLAEVEFVFFPVQQGEGHHEHSRDERKDAE
jgi:hypothetical protein